MRKLLQWINKLRNKRDIEKFPKKDKVGLCCRIYMQTCGKQEYIDENSAMWFLGEKKKKKKGALCFLSDGMGIEQGQYVAKVYPKTFEMCVYKVVGWKSDGMGDDRTHWDDGRDWFIEFVQMDDLSKHSYIFDKIYNDQRSLEHAINEYMNETDEEMNFIHSNRLWDKEVAVLAEHLLKRGYKKRHISEVGK